MIVMPHRRQKHRRMVVLVVIFLAVAGITTKRRHAHRDAEVLS